MGLIIIILIGIGFYGGYRYGSFHKAKENETLLNQLYLQERFSRAWASDATDKYNLSNQVANQQVQNLGTTIQLVIQILNQLQNSNNLNQLEDTKVSELISKAKSIGTLHD